MEKFSITKFFGSFFQSLSWVKSISLGLRILVIAVIGFSIWKAYFKQPEATQQQQFVIKKGGTAVIQQINKEKKNWYIFAEPYYFVETERNGWGAKIGVRWEF